MDYNRQPRRPRTLQLFKKNLLLNVTRRVVVEIIEADFSPGNHLGPSCELTEFLKIRIGRQLRFVGMDTDGGVNEFVLLSELNSAVKRSRPRAAADGDNAINASFAGLRNHLLTVRVELFHFEVSVGIYENQSAVLSHQQLAKPTRQRQPSAVVYFNLVPTGTSSRKLASTGFPPSGEAATIIPFDSSPRSFRGARFTTMTTLRPISVSGA